MTGRSIPVKWYAEQSWDDWQRQLRFGTGIEQRYQAFLALTQLGPAEKVAAMTVELLEDSTAELQAAALRWWQTADAVPADSLAAVRSHAEKLLAADDPDVRLEAAATLVRYEPHQSAAAMTLLELAQRDDLEPLTMAQLAKLMAVLSGQTDVTVPLLGKWMGCDHGEVREAAATALASLGSDATPQITTLITALDDEEPVVREQAALALGLIGMTSLNIVEALTMASNDEDTEVANVARAALESLKKK
jgi:HEAT repeat protein